VLRALGTNGGNYDVSNDDVIQWLQELEEEQPFVLTGADGATVEGRFTSPIEDPADLAERMCDFCPDIVAQGTETVEALAEDLATSNRLFFWWD